jgi:protein SCO1/2
MRGRKMSTARTYVLSIFLLAPIGLLIGAAGCGSPKPAEQPAVQQTQGPRRYALTGRVVSIDKPKLQVTVDGADIPGFMMAMTMGYSVKNANLLDPLSAEDQIKADVVVNGEDAYLENIVVVKKADAAKTATPGGAHSAPPQTDKK